MRSRAFLRRRSARRRSWRPWPELLDDLVGILLGGLGLLADELLHLVVRDLDPELVGDGLEHELARGDRRASPRSVSRSCVGVWPVTRR